MFLCLAKVELFMFYSGQFKDVPVTKISKKVGCGFLVQELYRWCVSETWYSYSKYLGGSFPKFLSREI